MKLRPIAATLALLFGPAVVSAVSRRAGLVTAACSVAILVYVILKNERISR